jgi:hypothetical protein
MPKDAFSGKLVTANDVETASMITSPDAAWLRFVKSMGEASGLGPSDTDVRFGAKGYVMNYASHRKAFEGASGLIVARTKK